MITTLITYFHTIQSHYMHVVTIPCTISTLRYQRPSPHEPVCAPVSPTLPPLLYSIFPRITFDFFVNPSPLTCPTSFSLFRILMTSFSATLFLVFIISANLVHEGIIPSLYLYQRTPICRTLTCIECISSHPSYPHRH